MNKLVKVYAITKVDDVYDVFVPEEQIEGFIPKTVLKVHITYGKDLREDMDREVFLNQYEHLQGCKWRLK